MIAIINKSQVMLDGTSLVGEASMMGLKPGEWPEFISVLDDRNEGFLFQRSTRLSPEAVTRILGIAKGKGIDATKLDSLIGGKLTEAPPSAELEILRQIRVAK